MSIDGIVMLKLVVTHGVTSFPIKYGIILLVIILVLNSQVHDSHKA